MSCDCFHHRYHIVHIFADSEVVYDHSQGTFDSILKNKLGSRKDIPSRFYEHGMTASQLKERYYNYQEALVRSGFPISPAF